MASLRRWLFGTLDDSYRPFLGPFGEFFGWRAVISEGPSYWYVGNYRNVPEGKVVPPLTPWRWWNPWHLLVRLHGAFIGWRYW